MSEKHFPFLGWAFLVRGDYVEARWPERKAVTTWPRRPGKNGSGFYDLCRQIFQERPVILSRTETESLLAFCEEAFQNKPQDVDDQKIFEIIEKLREALE